MGGTVYWLIRKIGPDVGAYFDAKSQVRSDSPYLLEMIGGGGTSLRI